MSDVLEQAKTALDKELDAAAQVILDRWREHVQSTDLEPVKVYKGGPGSGNFGHAGRPGKIGGSATGVAPLGNVLTFTGLPPVTGLYRIHI